MNLPFALEIDNKPNFFVEKIWNGLLAYELANDQDFLHYRQSYESCLGKKWAIDTKLNPKLHTIRRGERWAVGMPINLVVETAKNEFLSFAPMLNCIAVQRLEIRHAPKFEIYVDGTMLETDSISTLVRNDGFDDLNHFKLYFNNDFLGQIVHWTNLKYPSDKFG